LSLAAASAAAVLTACSQLPGSLAFDPGSTPAWPIGGFLVLALANALSAFGVAVALAQGCALALVYLSGSFLLGVAAADPATPLLPAVAAGVGLCGGATSLLFSRAGEGLLDALASPGSAGVLERRLLPLAALLPLAVAWLRTMVEGHRLSADSHVETVGALVLIAALVLALRYTGRVLTATEAQVSGERDRLRRLLLAHGHGLLLIERGGRIALANPAVARIVGTSIEQLHGCQIAQVLPEVAEALARLSDADVASHQEFVPLGPPRETLACHQGGHKVPVEVGLTPVVLDQAIYTLATVVDIRDRQHLQQLQKTQEAQLKLFIRHAPVAIAMLDHELRYIAASERWLQDYGLGQQPLVGRHHFEVFPQLSAAERDRVGNALLGQVDRRESMRFPRSDGGVDWFRSEIRPWRDDRQNIGGVLMFAELITTQIATEAALQRMRKETERLLRGQVDELQALNSEIVRTAQSGLLVYRASGACLLANEAAARMVGSTVEHLLSEDFRTIEIWRRHGLLDSALRALGSGDTIEFEVDYPRSGGETPQIAFTFSSVAAGNAQYLVVNAQDISSYIATQRELRAAGEAARQANDAKSMFIANMSHEIRTPMNAVLGLAYLLEHDETLGPEPRETARKIRLAGRGLMGIVDDILDLSKIEAGQLELEQIPFRLGDVFARVGTLLVGARRSAGTELILSEPPADADSLIGDPLRLEQVLLNLGGNALKFTPAGEVEIAAEVLQRDSDWITLRLAVRDTGIGIATEHQAQIFQPFSQADISTARRFGGTGLGLTICHRIISAMGGTLNVLSVPGQGSTFWCELRLRRDPAAAPRPPSIGGQRRALVIDARAATRRALCSQLERLEWQADAVASAAAARERLARRGGDPGYELVLVDSRLDDQAGSRLVRNLRLLPGVTMACTIVMLEPMGGAEGRPPSQRDADISLAKPIDSARLAAAVARVTRNRSGLAQPPAAVTPAASGKPLLGMRILVVDDSATNLEVASRILERFGATVTAADSGSAALALLKAAPAGCDVVLMDIQMPGLDGLEATRQLREMPGLAQLPVIALSGGAMVDQVEKARAAGMDDFLSKPFEARTLVAVLQRWCGGRPASAPAPAAPAPVLTLATASPRGPAAG
ncbi:MAG: response regulator, partial [Pseudomonadota bacterium]|nr:response regulator [Pseudomonadota bacterium]